MALSLPRRVVLQSGAALAVPMALALDGLSPESSQAPSGPAGHSEEQPLSGVLAGWLVVEADHGATVRFVQLDAASRPLRDIAAHDLTLAEMGVSLNQLCRRAHELALDVVARSWGVSASDCSIGPGRIEHAGRGQVVGYTLWVDMA
jgi:hypothetical protein